MALKQSFKAIYGQNKVSLLLCYFFVLVNLQGVQGTKGYKRFVDFWWLYDNLEARYRSTSIKNN
jgi:hypothetical protein